MVLIAKQRGHGSPAITLKVNAHLLHQNDGQPVEAIDAALAGQVKV